MSQQTPSLLDNLLYRLDRIINSVTQCRLQHLTWNRGTQSHSTVLVKQLPQTSEAKIRQFENG